MPLSWVVIAARNLRVRHVTFQEFACIRTKNLIQSQACHSLCYVCGDVYVYGAPATTIQDRRKVCKYGGPISHTMYFELGGFYLHSGKNLGGRMPPPPWQIWFRRLCHRTTIVAAKAHGGGDRRAELIIRKDRGWLWE